jgi:UDP-2,3-diacylglucosamine pyrophosphatase LpxH
MQHAGILSDPRQVRAIFISDVHLGSRYAHAEELLAFLQTHEPLYVYIVGDFIDGWRLRRRWRWEPAYNQILGLLCRWAQRGVIIRYVPGNHDAFPSELRMNFGLFEVAREFVHVSPEGRRFVVTHGDQFESRGGQSFWKLIIGGLAYDALLWSNHACNVVRRYLGMKATRFSTKVKTRVTTVVHALQEFEQRVVDYARSRRCDGAVCGHIHVPRISMLGSVTYCNTGDWVENCTALIEELDGTLRIVGHESGATVPRDLQPAVRPACQYSEHAHRQSPTATVHVNDAEAYVASPLPSDSSLVRPDDAEDLRQGTSYSETVRSSSGV